MKVGVLAIITAILLPFAAMAGPAADSDSDGTPDVVDGCSANDQAPNPLGCDGDSDGYLSSCDADFNNDLVVNSLDFSTAGAGNDFLDCFGAGVPFDPVAACDMNCDTVVNSLDFSTAGPNNDFLDGFAAGTPGPSGFACAGTASCP